MAPTFPMRAMTSTLPACSKVRVRGKLCPSRSCCFRPVIIMWMPLGLRTTGCPGCRSRAGSCAIFITPFSLDSAWNWMVVAIGLDAPSRRSSLVPLLTSVTYPAPVTAPLGVARAQACSTAMLPGSASAVAVAKTPIAMARAAMMRFIRRLLGRVVFDQFAHRIRHLVAGRRAVDHIHELAVGTHQVEIRAVGDEIGVAHLLLRLDIEPVGLDDGVRLRLGP